MAVQPWTYQGAVKAQYNGRDLTLVSRTNQTQLVSYPISMTLEKFNAIPSVQRVFEILTTRVPPPSVEAGLVGLNISSISAIDREFRKALVNYEEAFRRATYADSLVIARLETLNSNPFFNFFISIYRMLSGHHRMVVEKGSALRYAWMVAVGTAEELRIQKMQEIIQARAWALVRTLQEEIANGFFNQNSVQELDALERIYHTAAPTTPLTVQGIVVQTFVAPLLHQGAT